MHPCGAFKSKEEGLDVQRREKALFYIFCKTISENERKCPEFVNLIVENEIF